MISLVASAIVQVALVLLLGLAVWAIWGRKHSGFFEYVGLIGAPWMLTAGAFAFGCLNAVALLQSDELRALGAGERSVVAATNGLQSVEVLAAIAILAVFKTALSEEIFFFEGY